jgi:hypothetical protein
MSKENQQSPISDKLQKVGHAAGTLLGVLVIIVFGVGYLPLVWATIAYWLGLEVPPINGH